MDFSSYFLQLSAGCVGLAPVVPWRSVGKGYYVMMLSVGSGLLAIACFFRFGSLHATTGPIPGEALAGLVLFGLYGTIALAALGAFFGGRGAAGSALTLLAAVLGSLAICWDARCSAGTYMPRLIGATPSYTLFTVNFLSSSLLLGSALSAMLLGHWYLVVKDLPVRPLKTLTVLFFVALGARLLATVAAFLLDPEGGRAVADRSFLFVMVYGLFSLGTPMAMSWMVWGTVRIRSTQAATGILYGVVVFVLMGEAAGRFVLMKTGFPL